MQFKDELFIGLQEFYGILEKWADKTPKPLNTKWFRWVERGLRDRGVLVYEKYIDYVSFTKAKEEMHPKIRWKQDLRRIWGFIIKICTFLI